MQEKGSGDVTGTILIMSDNFMSLVRRRRRYLKGHFMQLFNFFRKFMGKTSIDEKRIRFGQNYIYVIEAVFDEKHYFHLC